jgi:hypothetical protein
MARFLAIGLGVWAVMHLYAFCRLSTVPWVATHIPRPALLVAAVALPMGEVTDVLVVERGDSRKDQCNSVVELVVRKPSAATGLCAPRLYTSSGTS